MSSSALTSLDEYRLLGHSGLRVSPLCLGAMTFGTSWNLGVSFEETKKMFDYYVEKGGNFIDTANFYTEGESEDFVGKLVTSCRSQMVVATKYSSNPSSTLVPPTNGKAPARVSNTHFGGNSRKSLVENVDASLKRLGLGYIDLLYVHIWDARTPIEETVRALDDVVRSGKVLYTAVSDTPAWVISRANTIAELRGLSSFIGLQTRYNLLDRSLESNLLPMATALDIGVIPWGAIAEGFLTGKHTRDAISKTGRSARIQQHAADPKNWAILDEVKAVAEEVHRTPVQVSLSWMLHKKGITSPLVGATSVEQLKENVAALELKLSPEQLARLDKVSAQPFEFPNNLLSNGEWTLGDTKVQKRYVIGAENI